ncbi:HAD family hydrolase [Paucibacter soli]|uniref:HAD family hydrolase n=1 Tax=Paucibacter soli TaxID=3133433 RepID=UPI0030ACE643
MAAEPLLAPSRRLRAVLFDLDGTLIDSAPDLAGAANEMRAERGLAPLAYELLRPMVGSGARGMLGISLEVSPAHLEFESLKTEFLGRYERRMLQQTAVFADVPPLLARLRELNLPWGIVTNKAERFALPMTRALGLAGAAAAVVGGDTTPHAKPHPGSLLEAARRIGVAPEHCVYVGDDERDILAGRAAGMLTVAASWGYLGHGGTVDAWGADFIIDEPLALLKLLQQA